MGYLDKRIRTFIKTDVSCRSQNMEVNVKKTLSGFLILAVISMTVVLNVSGKSAHIAAGIKTATAPTSLSDGEMARTVGGMSFKCFLATAAAGALAATGPGLALAIIAAGTLACACAKEFDEMFGTHFVEICKSAN